MFDRVLFKVELPYELPFSSPNFILPNFKIVLLSPHNWLHDYPVASSSSSILSPSIFLSVYVHSPKPPTTSPPVHNSTTDASSQPHPGNDVCVWPHQPHRSIYDCVSKVDGRSSSLEIIDGSTQMDAVNAMSQTHMKIHEVPGVDQEKFFSGACILRR
ncbi:unnamed protein product [Lactuca virosa]|uniref:Uncharacterized protein n=1 Tax=Lactuca virosa TaxID=75947 RepID=A0AAU9N0T9_9ASTR|nr:unnamed protein product [Lactuca virosa]